MNFDNTDFAFWTLVPATLIAGLVVSPNIAEAWEESMRPLYIVHEGEVRHVENSTDYFASFVGRELVIWDAQTREMINNAYFISEDFETPAERLSDYTFTGDPHIGSALFQIGEDGPIMRASIVGPDQPPRTYYVQTEPNGSELAI